MSRVTEFVNEFLRDLTPVRLILLMSLTILPALVGQVGFGIFPATTFGTAGEWAAAVTSMIAVIFLINQNTLLRKEIGVLNQQVADEKLAEWQEKIKELGNPGNDPSIKFVTIRELDRIGNNHSFSSYMNSLESWSELEPAISFAVDSRLNGTLSRIKLLQQELLTHCNSFGNPEPIQNWLNEQNREIETLIGRHDDFARLANQVEKRTWFKTEEWREVHDPNGKISDHHLKHKENATKANLNNIEFEIQPN